MVEGRLISGAIRNQKGNALLLVLTAMGFLSTMAYVIPTYLNTEKRKVAFNERAIHATQIASDLKELGKYLLLYEKVVYKDNPLDISNDRRTQLHQLWQQNFGSVSVESAGLLNACGGYDAVANFIGDLKVSNEPVFCPLYVRNSLMTGQMLEDMVFNVWARPGNSNVLRVVNGQPVLDTRPKASVVTGADGRYTVDLDMTSSLASANNYIPLNFNPDFLDLLRSLQGTARIRYEFYTDSSGFKASGAERYVRIIGLVSFRETGRADEVARDFSDSDSFILSTPSVKDFALFMPYPVEHAWTGRTIGLGPSEVALRPLPTRLMSRAISFGDATTEIFGRVFFNGDIDIPLDDLPVFHEAVIISGNFTYPIPPADRAKLRRKFLKGITLNYPAHRFLFDGPDRASAANCAVGVGPLDLTNVFGLHCPLQNSVDKGQFGMIDYIKNMQGVCSDSNITASGGDPYWNYSFTQSRIQPANRSFDCVSQGLFIRGGTTTLTVSGPFAFVASPMVKVTVSGSRSSVYGTLFTGAAVFNPGTKIYSIANMRPTLPGIIDEAVLARLNGEAAAIFEGVGVPLPAFPLIQSAREGMN